MVLAKGLTASRWPMRIEAVRRADNWPRPRHTKDVGRGGWSPIGFFVGQVPNPAQAGTHALRKGLITRLLSGLPRPRTAAGWCAGDGSIDQVAPDRKVYLSSQAFFLGIYRRPRHHAVQTKLRHLVISMPDTRLSGIAHEIAANECSASGTDRGERSVRAYGGGDELLGCDFPGGRRGQREMRDPLRVGSPQ
jgi:hypothetical protein